MNIQQHRQQGHHHPPNAVMKSEGNVTLTRQSKIAKAKDLLHSLSSHQVAALKDLGFDLVSIIPKLENPLLTQSDIDFVMKSNKTCEDIIIDEKAKKFLFKFPKDLGFRALGEFKNRMEERVNKDDVRDPNRFLMGILNRYWNMKPQSLQQTFRLEEHITKLIENGDIKKGVIDAKLKDFLENMDTDDAVKCLNEYVYEIMKGKSVRNHSAYLMGICKRCFTAKQKKVPSGNIQAENNGVRNMKPKNQNHHHGHHQQHSMSNENRPTQKPKSQANSAHHQTHHHQQQQQYRNAHVPEPEPYHHTPHLNTQHTFSTQQNTTPHNAFAPYTLAVQQQQVSPHSQQQDKGLQQQLKQNDREQQQSQQQHAPLFCPPPSMGTGNGIWAYRPSPSN